MAETPKCPFCHPKEDPDQHIVFENDTCYFLQHDRHQDILQGSGVIVPKQHRETTFDLTLQEWIGIHELLHLVKDNLDERFSPDGYTLGWNVGAVSNQTIPHAHFHVVPRYADEPHAGKGLRYWLKQEDNRRIHTVTEKAVTEKIYPDCPVVRRTVEIGGVTKTQLLEKLRQNGILMNESAERLFASDKFSTSETQYIVQTVELTVRELGFPDGAALNEIFNRARDLGLELGPVELGPYLRLAYQTQPEGYLDNPQKQHQAPSGSITIASKLLTADHDFPKGFYLRRISGILWLRGYRADDLHVWNPDDHFVFCESNVSLEK